MAAASQAGSHLVASHPRAAGVFLLAIGGGLSYLCILKPMREVEAHAAQVSISMKGIVMSIVLVCLGLLYVILGPFAARLLNPAPGASKFVSYVVAVILCVIGFGAFFALRAYFQNHGYQF